MARPRKAGGGRDLPDGAGPECAFVLSGGGVYGAEQVGMLRALIEAGHVPDLISAVSVGALNGVAIAERPSLEGVDHLERVWRGIDAHALFPGTSLQRALAMVRRRQHICENSGMRRLIDESVRVEAFEDLQIPFYVSTAELQTGTHRIFESGPLRPVLLATTALPGVFPPVELDGALMVDGGVLSNVPTSPAVRARPRRMFILDVSRPVSNRFPQTPLGVIIQAFNITRNLCASRDIEAAQSLPGAVVLPRPEDEPAVAFDDTSHTEELLRAGYERTRRFLADEWSEVA